MRTLAIAIVVLLGSQLADAAVVLTRSSKMYEGEVSVTETAVVVTSESGPNVLPRSDAVFYGDTKMDAYRVLAKDALSVSKRLKLAKWCLEYDLHAQTIEQCEQVFRLSRGNAEAAELIAQAQAVGTVPVGAVKRTKPPAKPRSLPRETMAYYAQSVLPLLRNSCSGSGCHHHNSDTGFAIRRAVYRSDRAATLDSILSQVDQLTPSQSPLLHYAMTPHGGLSEAPLSGRLAPQQIEMLTRWIAVAATQVDRDQEDELDLTTEADRLKSFGRPAIK